MSRLNGSGIDQRNWLLIVRSKDHGSVNGSLLKIIMDHPISSDTVDDGAVRRSQRIRPLTQKAEENALQEMKQTFWIHHGKFAINLNEVEIQLSGDCDDDTLETMQSDIKKGYREIEAIYDEIKVRSIASPDQEIRLGIERVKADTDLLVNTIQLKNMADDKDTSFGLR